MITKTVDIKFDDVAIMLNPIVDQVAVAKKDIEAGVRVFFREDVIEVKAPIKKGHRFAVVDIDQGEYVKQGGHAFGRSRGILKGEAISLVNIDNVIPETNLENFSAPARTIYQERFLNQTFLGYVRKNGSVGTRNFYLIVPTSMCSSQTALQVASTLENDQTIFQKYPSLDGIVSIPHTEGCGCDATVSIDRLLRILEGYIRHPNVGGCLVIDLGCEQTNYGKVESYIKQTILENLKPIDWLTIEESGGVDATRHKAEEIITHRLPEVADIKRELCPLEKLVVGTNCGASDSFSAITANPLIGNVVDKVVWGKGSAILSEIPELVGTFEMFLPRFRSIEVAGKFRQAIQWYENLAQRLGMTLEANLVPKNKEGGLLNNYVKSLGGALKGGRTAIEDVIDYGESIKKTGLNIMQGPGGDLESVTGIVSCGANIMCFSTGKGTPTGNAICPVVKITSTDEVFKKLSNDMDFNGGRLLTDQISVDELGDELLNFVKDVASGKRTAAERLKQRQFQVWTAGKLSL